MAATHEEIQKLLTGLEADVPWLMKAYPDPCDFVDAFAHQADLITDNLLGAEENAWVLTEISRILTKFGYADDLAA